MTGCMQIQNRRQQRGQRRCALRIQSYQRIESQPEESAAAGDRDAIGFAISVDQAGLAIGVEQRDRFLLFRRDQIAGLKLVDNRTDSRSHVVIHQRGKIGVAVLRELGAKRGRMRERQSRGARRNGALKQRGRRCQKQVAVGKRVVDRIGDFRRCDGVISEPVRLRGGDGDRHVRIIVGGGAGGLLERPFDARRIVHFNGDFPARRGQQRAVDGDGHLATQVLRDVGEQIHTGLLLEFGEERIRAGQTDQFAEQRARILDD